MPSTNKGYLHSLPDAVHDRVELDSYWTPAYCVFDLLTLDPSWPRIVHEPACGEGHISRALLSKGFKVVSSDLRDPPLYGTGGVDFLRSTNKVEAVITNPPYNMANEFLGHASKMCGKFAFLMRLHGLVSKGRFAVYNQVPGVRVGIYTTPIFQMQNGVWKKGSAFTHAWVICEMSGTRYRTFEWINRTDHVPLDLT